MDNEYLVRGAMLTCQCGTHPRRVNLPESHGVYMKDKPVLRENDCVADENIKYFGVCQGDTPPDGAQTIRVVNYGQDDTDKTTDGPKCCPNIVGQWRNTKENSTISGDQKAVTMDSYLVCQCGGLIQPVTSGQEYEE